MDLVQTRKEAQNIENIGVLSCGYGRVNTGNLHGIIDVPPEELTMKEEM